jgi:ABC-type bacteriocin/lantibiotic exporter with double-glycine peptidase domain
MAKKSFNPALVQGYISIVVVIIVLIVVFLLLKRLGLIKSKTQRKSSKQIQEEKAKTKIIQDTINKSDLFSPTKFKDVSKDRLLPVDVARDKALKIRKSFGFFNDDEATIYGVFRSLTDKIQVSQLAFYYAELTGGGDMAQELKNFLNKKELKEIYDIIQDI